MSFLYPEFIYMMLPVLLILFGMLLTQADLQEQFFSKEVLKKLRVDSDQFSTKTRNIFYLFMFLFLLLALADPVIKQGEVYVKRVETPYSVVIDLSKGSDLRAQKANLATLLKKAHALDVSLVGYANESYMIVPPTKDYQYMMSLVEGLEPLDEAVHQERLYRLLQASYRLYGKGQKILFLSAPIIERQSMNYMKKRQIEVSVLEDQNVDKRTLAFVQESGGHILSHDALSEFFHKQETQNEMDTEQPIYFHLFILPIALAMIMLIIATSSFHKGEKHYVPLWLVLIAMSSLSKDMHADLLNFERLEKAKKAYERGVYRESSHMYKQYALEYESSEALYNAANAYYKSAHYETAIRLYERIHFIEKKKNFMLYYNLGNSWVKIGGIEALKAAQKAYEKALSYQKNSLTQENLEAVRSWLYNHRNHVDRSVAVRQKTSLLKPSRHQKECAIPLYKMTQE